MSAANTLVPELRFPGFKEIWTEDSFGKLFKHRQEKGDEALPLLSLTAEKGIIPQNESGRKDNSNADKSRYLKVARGDIAYNTMRMWEGRSALSTLEGLVSPAYTVCAPKKGTLSAFFAYYIKTPFLIEQFNRNSQGLTKDTYSLKFPSFAKIKVFRPSPAEQQKIADCLGSLDDLIAAHRRKLDALQDHKKGLLQQLFPAEGEATPKLRFPEFEGKWEEKRLPEISDNLNNRRVPITASERSKGNVPYYGATGIIDYVEDYLFDEVLLCISEDGANLVVRTYPIAFTISGKTWVNNHAHVLRFREPYTQIFVELYINHTKIDDYITGAAQPKLNRQKLDSIPIPLPLPLEQQKIADCLSALDALITAQTKQIGALKTQKKGLMQKLFPNP